LQYATSIHIRYTASFWNESKTCAKKKTNKTRRNRYAPRTYTRKCWIIYRFIDLIHTYNSINLASSKTIYFHNSSGCVTVYYFNSVINDLQDFSCVREYLPCILLCVRVRLWLMRLNHFALQYTLKLFSIYESLCRMSVYGNYVVVHGVLYTTRRKEELLLLFMH
jgi:hypothetical protein